MSAPPYQPPQPPVQYQQYPPQYQPPPVPPELLQYRYDVRYTPVAPLGAGGQVTGTELAELGALLSASGMEKSGVTAMMAMIQKIAIQTTLNGMPQLIGEIQDLWRKRVNTLMQNMRSIPTYNAPPTLFGRVTNPVTYVPLDAVLNVLSAAMNQPAQHT